MGSKFCNIMGLLGVLNFFMPMSLTIDPNCDFYQDMVVGQDYYIYSEGYPQYYGPSVACRWIGKSPAGTAVVISCSDIYIPASVNCESDHLAISLSGDSTFQNSQRYCGVSNTTQLTESNSIAVGLFSAYNSPGGRFLCTLTAIQVQPTPTPEPLPTDCDCGSKKETRIVGGQATDVNEYPWMGALVDKLSNDAFCGASIISNRYALTAAHCLLHYEPRELWLLAGGYDLSTDQNTSSAVFYDLSAFQPHSSYNQTTKQDDLAVVKTAAPIQFTMFVSPVCLPFRYTTNDFYSQIVTALGWGFQDFSGNKATVLQEVDLSVVANAECDEKISEPVSYDKQICTYAPGKDTCLSDSGGPLLWQDPTTRKLHVVGVISYGVGCATTKPSVNTRVTAYLPWVLSVTSDAVYCIK